MIMTNQGKSRLVEERPAIVGCNRYLRSPVVVSKRPILTHYQMSALLKLCAVHGRGADPEHAGILLEFGSRDKRTASVVHIHMAGRDKLVEWNDLKKKQCRLALAEYTCCASGRSAQQQRLATQSLGDQMQQFRLIGQTGDDLKILQKEDYQSEDYSHPQAGKEVLCGWLFCR